MDAVARARAAFARGATTEDVIRELRDAGFNQIDSVKALRDGAGMGLRDADIAVLKSEAWSDQYDRTIEMREGFWAVIAEHADEIETGPDGEIAATFDLTKRRDEGSDPD